MSQHAKTEKLFHRIKYRNSVDPNIAPVLNLQALNPAAARRRHRVIQYMQKIILRTNKSKERGAKVTPLHYIPSLGHYNDVEEFCRNCPTTSMSRFQENEILRRVAVRDLQDNYPTLLHEIMADAREQFLDITHRSGIGMKLKTDGDRFRLTPYKYLGRTPNYQAFLSTRAEFSSKFLLHYPLIKRILYECVTNLPYELFNLNHWLKHPVELNGFHNELLDLANDASQSLQEFYRKIVMLVEGTDIDYKRQGRSYIEACTGLLSVNISRTIAHTLLHVVNFTASKDHTPYLQLNITFKDCLILEPTADDVVDIYIKFLRRIITFVNQFAVLEKYKMPGLQHKNIYLCLTDEFFNSCLKRIDQNIKAKYAPISLYIKKLESDFVDIYDDISSGGNTVLTTDLIFEEGCNKILHFRSYLDKVAHIPDNTYFNIGPLNLTEYRETLRRTLITILDNIFDKLSAQHEWEVNDICEAFEIINIRVAQKPITTEELIETGKYMAWVRNEYLEELKERVIRALEYLTKLIQLGPLTDAHMATNSRAINWIDRIVPILENNNTVYEQLKFEAEEKLQRIIEEINVDIRNVYPSLSILDSMDDMNNVKMYLKSINLHLLKIKEIENKIEWINSEEVSLSFPKSVYAEFEELKNYVYPFYHLLKLCLDTQRNLSVWLDGQFDLIKYEDTKRIVEKYHVELMSTHKVYRSKLRQAQDENLSVRFKGTVDDPDMLNWPAPLKLCSKAINLIQDFEPCLAIIKIMCNEALMKRHWNEMSKVAGLNITPNAGTTLRKITQIDIKSNLDKYEIISVAATKEKELLEDLNGMHQEWTGIDFSVTSDLLLILHLEDIERIIDDHLIKVRNMMNSVFVKPFQNKVRDFYNYLIKTQAVLEQIQNVQSELLYFRPLLSCREIVTKVQYETDLFKEVTVLYQNYVTRISCRPNVMENVVATDFLKDLVHCSEKLEVINKGATNYCEGARQYFERLYFVSNDELFALLSLTEKVENCSYYLKHIFTGVHKIQFNDEREILAVESRTAEQIQIGTTIKCEGCVEKWLKLLETEITLSIRKMINKVLENYQQAELNIWLVQWPLQAVLIATKIIFTANCHEALPNQERLLTYKNDTENDLKRIVKLATCNVNNSLGPKLQSIAIVSINNRDILQNMLDSKIQSHNDFKWLVQFRYYTMNGDSVVNILGDRIKYGYEYLCNIDQIVITPSVERCHRSLTVAYNFNLFGICEGATGMGKSEAVKGLAQALGMHYVFFNCPDQINYDVISNLLEGASRCGSWLYLNNFEHLDFKTISILSQEIYKISSSLKAQRKQAVLGSTETDLKHCFICISIERSFREMPENFKTLFRTVAMTPPDYRMIAEVGLCCRGFKNSRSLSGKIVVVQQLLADLSLSKCCDLAILKQIISGCPSGNDEEQIVFRAIRNVNISDLSHANTFLLDRILSEVFPSLTPDSVTVDLTSNIATICRGRGLQPTGRFLDKIRQLNELMQCKNGVIITGQILTGKTELVQVLKETDSFKSVTLNPKSISLEQLYGSLDYKFGRWIGGIITGCLRNGDDNQWIIFDGPIDCVWAENLRSVLDDNRKLCLGSGETVTMSRNTSIIFETDKLTNASPAIVSRCAMIYLDVTTVGWLGTVRSWIGNNKFVWATDFECIIIALFNWLVPSCIEFIRTSCSQLYKISDLHLIKTMTVIVQILLNDACNNNTSKKEDDLKNMTTWIQATFLQAGVWSFGSVLSQDCRLKFDEFYKQLWRGLNQRHPYPKEMEKLEVSIPQDGLILDYVYIYKMKGNWKFWPDTLKNEKVEISDFSCDIFVPTIDTVKYCNILSMHINHNHPVLIAGARSTGKSSYLRNLLINKLDRNRYEPSFVNLTPKIAPNQLQTFILSKLNKTDLNRYGPSKGKSGVFLIDDLNCPIGDNFGTRPPIELLRQLLTQKSCYNGTQLLYLDRFNIVGALSLACGNQQLCQRFLRQFNVFAIDDIADDNILRIWSTILSTEWKKIGYTNDITTVVNQIVTSTQHIYKFIATTLKPTLNRSFYCFNLRNFGKIIQGCAAIRKESTDQNKKLYVKLWVHEILRVFTDRLLQQDKKLVHDEIIYCVDCYFKEDCSQLFEHLLNEAEEFSTDVFSRALCGCYSSSACSLDESTFKQLYDLVESSIKVYNSQQPNKLELVVFDYIIEHLSRICRILTLSNTNMLLLGSPGLSRESLTKLVCHMYDKKLFKPKFCLNYDATSWRQDVKECVREAGGYGKSCAFLLKEQFLQSGHFFEDIDSLLRTGQILDLYSAHEKYDIMNLVRTALQSGNPNIDVPSDLVFLYYEKRCLENLHIVMCVSPSEFFRKTVQFYPSLVSQCEVDCYKNWPPQALECIGKVWTSELKFNDNLKIDIIRAFNHFHNLIANESKDIPITTGSYLEFVKLYYDLITSQQKEISTIKSRYLAALEKLSFAAVQISQMQKNLAEYQPQLEAMTAKAIDMTEEIGRETIEVEKASNLVRLDEKVANEQAADAQILKLDCEADLAQAIPILEDAIQALNTLKPTDITLVKSMKNPPDAIKLVMAAVCVIKDVKPDRIPDPSTGRKTIDYWGPSKRILGDMNFLQTLKEFDKDHIKQEIMVKVRRDYLPHKDFKPHVVAKASSAAEGLCKWIIAMDMYDKVAKEVAPKKEKLEKAEREYSMTMAILNEKKEQVARIEQKLANLHIMLSEATSKQQKLQRNVDICKRKLSRAQRLIGGLSDEKIRWIRAVDQLDSNYKSLAGDVLVSAATIAYLGPLTHQFRYRLISKFLTYLRHLQIPINDSSTLVNIFERQLQVEEWHLCGLPCDQFFLDGAIIAKFTKRWCFFIDPQNQAGPWIKKVEKYNDLGVTKLTMDNYFDDIVKHINDGKPILVENIASTEPIFATLVRKICHFRNDHNCIDIVGQIVPCNPNFRLYMTTQARNLQLSSEFHSQVTVINFNLTKRALKDQLLTSVVEVEKPSLKRLKQNISAQRASNKAALIDIEDRILEILSQSNIDILEDEKALKVLDESKEISKEVALKQQDLVPLERILIDFKQGYLTVANYSTTLYFCVFDLTKINPLYAFSLQWFIDLYVEAIQKAHRYKDLEHRCASLVDTVTFMLHTKVSRAVFHKDRIIFTLLMCSYLLQSDGKFQIGELTELVKRKFPKTKCPHLKPEWLSSDTWDKICYFSQLNCGHNCMQFFLDNVDLFHTIYSGDLEENLTFAEPWHHNITKFFIMAILKPDKLYNASLNLVREEMGVKYLENVSFDISTSFIDSYILSPIMVIQAAGSDPNPDLLDFARTKKFERKLRFTSLQDDYMGAIEEAQYHGLWVCLQDCHLFASEITKLEIVLDNMDYDNTHENFRLWITTNQSDALPITLLERSIKMVKDPSDSIRDKLLDLYCSNPVNDDEFYDSCPERQEFFAKLLYGIAFFHCVVLERRNFVNFWNYKFSKNDFEISALQLPTVVHGNTNVLEEISFLLGECNYGGQVSDKWYQKLLKALIEDSIGRFAEGRASSFGDLPIKSDHQDYVHYITKLSKIDNFEIFGLHANYTVVKNVQRSQHVQNLLSKVLVLPADDFDISSELVLKLVAKIPKLMDLPAEANLDQSLDVVVITEIKRYNKLIKLITSTFGEVQKALDGLSPMREDLWKICADISHNRIPKLWSKVSYAKCTMWSLSKYVDDLTTRVHFWNNFKSIKLIWLGAFFQPKALLTAIKLDYCKNHDMLDNIDGIIFKFGSSGDANSITLTDLFLSGAKWNDCLVELPPKMLYDHLSSVEVVIVDKNISGNFYECPLYNNFTCGDPVVNFIQEILLRTEMSPKYWVKRAVSIFCQIGDHIDIKY